MPLKVSGMISNPPPQRAVARITIHTASPITGTTSRSAGYRRLAVTLATIAMTKISATITSEVQSIWRPRGAS